MIHLLRNCRQKRLMFFHGHLRMPLERLDQLLNARDDVAALYRERRR